MLYFKEHKLGRKSKTATKVRRMCLSFSFHFVFALLKNGKFIQISKMKIKICCLTFYFKPIFLRSRFHSWIAALHLVLNVFLLIINQVEWESGGTANYSVIIFVGHKVVNSVFTTIVRKCGGSDDCSKKRVIIKHNVIVSDDFFYENFLFISTYT